MINRAGRQTSIRVAIHVDVTPGIAGGTAQSTQGLIHSLGALEGPERYVLGVQTREQAEWVRRYAGPNQDIEVAADRKKSRHVSPRGAFRTGAPRTRDLLRRPVGAIRRIAGSLVPQHPHVAISDGYYESLACDVLHFPTQPFILCSVPTVYNPHDLAHLHYPQFWPADEIARREVVYRTACQTARTVVVGSQWIKQDVVRQYAIHPDKVQVIPWASPAAQFEPIDEAGVRDARERLALPEVFALYPAVTWPHKNHLRLLEALAMLRDTEGLTVNLVCTGARWESHWPRVEQRIADLQLGNQVRFLGFVPEAELRALYRLAQFLVLPTLFEADSCPVHEAWSEGLPVASSNHTAMPEQVGEAGLLFDAGSVEAIADAIRRMATDHALRDELRQRGYRRVGDFDWIRTAKAFRAVYRRVAGIDLTDEDRFLLEWDWMKDPQRAG
jgi:glycosyltransferase involved in cell wall biosynthesis